MKLFNMILCSVLVATVSLIGFEIMYTDNNDNNNSLVVQEASAQKPYPPEQIGRLPTSDMLPVWTPNQPAQPTGMPANMSNVNVVFNVVIPYLGGWIHEDVSPYFADPSVSFRYVTLILNVGYDASAPYHPTAVGVYSNIENRPVAEYADDENINVAVMHALYHLALELDSNKKDRWDEMLTRIGLDPTDRRGLDLDCSTTQTISDPVVIGNFAGKCVIEGRQNDGFNYGNTYSYSGTYPIIPSTVNYTPVNTATNLVDPSKWQPQLVTKHNTQFVQQFVTPQWANTEPYAIGFNPRDIRTPSPVNSDYANNMAGYKAQADEVINAVAGLTDEQKMIIEYFDNKAREVLFFPAVEAINPETGMPHRTADFFRLDFMLHIAQFDAGIFTWQEKAIHDAVRPITAIQTIYGDQMIRTFNGQMVSGNDWTSYADVGDHPEYPSATACFCAAQAAAWKQYHGGSDTIPTFQHPLLGPVPGFTGVLPAGSSIYEPDITPQNNVTVNFDTWSDYVDTCGESRIWAGLHFRDAVDASIEVCDDIGNLAFAYFDTLLDGTAQSPRTPAVALTPYVAPVSAICR